jgi:hypothetical protein
MDCQQFFFGPTARSAAPDDGPQSYRRCLRRFDFRGLDAWAAGRREAVGWMRPPRKTLDFRVGPTLWRGRL